MFRENMYVPEKAALHEREKKHLDKNDPVNCCTCDRVFAFLIKHVNSETIVFLLREELALDE